MDRSQPAGARREKVVWQGLKDLCLKAYSDITGCPRKKIRYFLQKIDEGEVTAPLDGRKVPLKRPETKKEDVEAFFSFLYTNLAEPLAIASKDRLAEDEGSNVVEVALPEWVGDDHDLLQTVMSA